MGLKTASSVNFDVHPLDRVIGFYVYDLTDKEVADIRDLLIDQVTHKVRYAVVEIGGMLSIQGKKILLPWKTLIKAGMSRMDINCAAEMIIAAPAPMNPLAPTRVEEESIHSFFNVDPYWFDEPEDEEAQPEPYKSTSSMVPPVKPVDDETIDEKLELENNEQEPAPE